MAELKTKDNKYTILVDNQDYDLLKKYVWTYYLHQTSKKPYIYTGSGPRVYIHRKIMDITDPNIQVDHKNRDPLDNRRENLRICERGAQNAINRPKQKNNTSGYKGVFVRTEKCYNKPDKKKYRAMIRVDQKLIRLGQFETAEEAALAYNEAALKYFKEFAYLNVVPKKEEK